MVALVENICNEVAIVSAHGRRKTRNNVDFLSIVVCMGLIAVQKLRQTLRTEYWTQLSTNPICTLLTRGRESTAVPSRVPKAMLLFTTPPTRDVRTTCAVRPSAATRPAPATTALAASLWWKPPTLPCAITPGVPDGSAAKGVRRLPIIPYTRMASVVSMGNIRVRYYATSQV